MSSTELEDKLASKARDGDQRALAKIFSDYHQPLYRYCLAIVGDRQDAEDALQETMIKVLRSLPGEEREIALRPWLYRIAHNESIDQLRRRRKNPSLDDSEPAPGGGLAERVEVRERLRQLISDLSALPERQRGVLLMREAAGLDFDEIGAALETTSAVARQTLYEARLGLREMDIGREMDCAAVTKALSDGDRRVQRRRDIRAHLRDCASCRGFVEEIDGRRADLAAIAPLPAVAAAALLNGIIAGGSGGAGVAVGASAAGKAGGSGAGAIAASSAAKSVGTVTLLKGAATVAVVVAVGAVAADKGGLVHFGDHGATPTPQSSSSTQPDEGDPSAPGRGTENAGGGAAGLGTASRAKATRAKARAQLGTATAASPRPRSRSATENDGPPPANPESDEAGVHTPPAAAHGQETAAANHAAHEDKKAPSGKVPTEHPAHPAHPIHPEKPETPAKEAESPPPTEAPPASSAEHAANPPGQGK
jgi:RNA polymerase sigma factor (sigma-70 family)